MAAEDEELGAGGGPALERLERQPAFRRIPDEELTVQDQTVGKLLDGGRDEVGEPILDQRAPSRSAMAGV
ncbi:hypothetical protein ABT144_21400 [Streptomyces sp. NPDC002039]|uniref:hypothetical protein n=1 Tax=Streptomyces sp. NPDC002039 TaxID=3154660 RepID=UPI00332EB606